MRRPMQNPRTCLPCVSFCSNERTHTVGFGGNSALFGGQNRFPLIFDGFSQHLWPGIATCCVRFGGLYFSVRISLDCFWTWDLCVCFGEMRLRRSLAGFICSLSFAVDKIFQKLKIVKCLQRLPKNSAALEQFVVV